MEKCKCACNCKRVAIATILGVLAGVLCHFLASSGGAIEWALSANIISSRALLGFAIGISAVKMGHWTVHGLVMGALFSLPLAFGSMIGPEHPEFTKTAMFAWTVVFGMGYGFIIELVATVLFKAKQA